MQDQEMLNELIVESREHLSAIEPDLLELEQKGDAISGELINRVFRAVHSIKGGFGFFGIEHITKLSHAMENVMAKIRDKNLAITPEVTDALLKGVDKLRTLLDDVANAESIPIEAEIAGLNPFLDQQVQAKTKTKDFDKKTSENNIETSIHQKHPDIQETQMIETVKNGKHLYQITLNSRTDLSNKDVAPSVLLETWEKFGEVMDVSFDFDNISGILGSSNKEIMYSVVYSTVLEPDLVSAGTGIPEEQIFTIDLTETRDKIKSEAAAKQTAQSAAQKISSSQEQGTSTAAKTQIKADNKIEDALRVKVGLLNNLMNLAGELVLSRNQLMQSVNRKLSEAVETESLLKNVTQQFMQSTRNMQEASRQGHEIVNQTADKEIARLKETVAQSLSMRLMDVPGLNSIMQNIDMVTSLLQESIMQTRLQPISVVFAKFPRLVRDLAKKLGKEINLTLVGQDVELDKSIVEQLSDPLTHLIRNSVDHGVESQEDRKKAGKPVQGEVVLRAFHEGGKVHIQIEDDGAGVNRNRVKEKAIEKGLFTVDDLAKMTDREIDNIIMLPGFSTAAVVSDVSGRGVGMDVVKTNIERLGGTVDIESEPGKGTIITMKLPLTLAIISSLIVSAGGRRFAIPQVGIDELVRIRAKDVTKRIDRLKNCEVMRLRGKLLPLVRLEIALDMVPTFIHPESNIRMVDKRKRWSDRRGLAEDKPQESQSNEQKIPAGVIPGDDRRGKGPDRRGNVSNAVKIVVLKYQDQHYGLVVEEVYDSEEIVVKPLSGYLKSSQCYAGSTIMGDGSVAMILDTNGLAQLSNLKFNDLEKDIETEKEKFLKDSNKKLRELLLFEAGENGNFGVDLSMVARVEKVETSRIVNIGGKDFLKYEDRSMRLLKLSDYLPVSAATETSNYTFVIVPKGSNHIMGIIANQVKDVVKTDALLDTSNIRGNGILGSAMINSALTLVVDMKTVFKSAEPEMFSD